MSVHRPASRGSAAVELAGITVVVATLAAGLAVWAQHELRPPERPPPVVAALARPVRFEPRVDLGLGLRPWPFDTWRDDGLEPAARAVVWWGRRTDRIFVRNFDAFSLAFAKGFVDATAGEVIAVIRDPAGEVVALVDLAQQVTMYPADPSRLGDAYAQVRAVSDHIVRVYTEDDPREAARLAGRDLGGLSADIVVARGRGILRRKAREWARERAARRGRDGGAGRESPFPDPPWEDEEYLP